MPAKQTERIILPMSLTLYTSVCHAGKATVTYFRDIVPDEQGPAAEAGAVFDNRPPHRSTTNCSEVGR